VKRRSWCGALLIAAVVLFPGLGLAEGRNEGNVGGPEAQDADRLFRQSVVLGVPETELADLVATCQGAGLRGEEISRLLALVARAKLAGLPHEDLLNKLREGLAKGAPPEAVQKALEDKARVLRKAKDLVDTLLLEGWVAHSYDFAVKLVGDALEAGASGAEVLCSVRQNRPCDEGIPDVRRAFLSRRDKE
jgi:hypothetical protein